MGTIGKVFLVLLALSIVFGLSVVGTVISVNNECVLQEKGIQGQYAQNKNNYDNFYKKVKEVAKVPEKYSAEFKQIYDGIMKGRYGEKGSEAMVQWIQENNPVFDPGLYHKLAQVIESGRNNFEFNQKILIDRKRNYETYIGQFPNSFISRFLGYPKIDLKEYDIVTSAVTEKVFETKQSDPIDF